jgi:flagellar biosynthesis/type III secretory pathway protein FliH
LEEVGPEAKDAIVTIAELIEEGRQEGRQEGLQEALQASRQRSQALLLRMLRRRFGDAVDTQVEQRVAAASIEQLETWTEGVPSATTLSKLFAD